MLSQAVTRRKISQWCNGDRILVSVNALESFKSELLLAPSVGYLGGGLNE